MSNKPETVWVLFTEREGNHVYTNPEQCADKEDLVKYDMDGDGYDNRYEDGFQDGQTKQRGILGPQIDKLKEENLLLRDAYNSLANDIGNGEHVDFTWIKDAIEDAAMSRVVRALNAKVAGLEKDLEKFKPLGTADDIEEALTKSMSSYDEVRSNLQIAEVNVRLRDDEIARMQNRIKHLDERDSVRALQVSNAKHVMECLKEDISNLRLGLIEENDPEINHTLSMVNNWLDEIEGKPQTTTYPPSINSELHKPGEL